MRTHLGANRARSISLVMVALAWSMAWACGGSSKVERERHDGANGGSGGTGGHGGSGAAGSATSGSGGTGARPSSGGSGAISGSAGDAGSSPRGGQGGSGGNGCAAARLPTTDFCPVGGYGCPLTLDSLRHVDAICRNDGEDGHYSVCSGGYSRLEWTVGFESTYDLVFSTATGALVSGGAHEYDAACGTLTTTAGTPPNLGHCETCSFCRSAIDEPGGAGGEAGARGEPRCAFDSNERVTLP